MDDTKCSHLTKNSTETDSVVPGEIITTGKWNPSRPGRVSSISTISMTSRDTSYRPRPSIGALSSTRNQHQRRRMRIARCSGGGGHAATVANAAEVSEGNNLIGLDDTAADSRGREKAKSHGSGSSSGESGFVHGIFTMLGLRKRARGQVTSQSGKENIVSRVSSVECSQEIVEICVVSPKSSPTPSARSSRAASLLWRDSAEGTAMFSRKASGSIATASAPFDEGKYGKRTSTLTVGGTEPRTVELRHEQQSRRSTEFSLPSSSEMQLESAPVFPLEEQLGQASQDSPSEASKLAIKRRRATCMQWDNTIREKISLTDSSALSSPFHREREREAVKESIPPVMNPSLRQQQQQQRQQASTTYRYEGMSGSEVPPMFPASSITALIIPTLLSLRQASLPHINRRKNKRKMLMMSSFIG